MRVLVTGGAGFIGSELVRQMVTSGIDVMNLDKLTYAGNSESLHSIADRPNYHFVNQDICHQDHVSQVLSHFQPDAVMHLAAESHVDRSIAGPRAFIETNVTGTFALLEATRLYWEALPGRKRDAFRFLHVSTDEVYGSLGEEGYFSETTPYRPNSPYSASKAASDHLVRAWHHTYGLPILITHSSNNYGPYQFPEKLIPLMIIHALQGKPLPVYGQGRNIRDWVFVSDHAQALLLTLEKGRIGETYNIGGMSEFANIDVVRQICRLIDELAPLPGVSSCETLISFVADRRGHDYRYAIDCGKIHQEIGWRPQVDFESGLRKTVEWYTTHQGWWQRIQSGSHRHRVESLQARKSL